MFNFDTLRWIYHDYLVLIKPTFAFLTVLAVSTTRYDYSQYLPTWSIPEFTKLNKKLHLQLRFHQI